MDHLGRGVGQVTLQCSERYQTGHLISMPRNAICWTNISNASQERIRPTQNPPTRSYEYSFLYPCGTVPSSTLC